jgi:hypothetical protein
MGQIGHEAPCVLLPGTAGSYCWGPRSVAPYGSTSEQDPDKKHGQEAATPLSIASEAGKWWISHVE